MSVKNHSLYLWIQWNWTNSMQTALIQLVMHSTYFGSVILRISLQRRPMNVTDSSTGVNFGIGIWVDWYMLCQSWIWKISFSAFYSVTIAHFYFTLKTVLTSSSTTQNTTVGHTQQNSMKRRRSLTTKGKQVVGVKAEKTTSTPSKNLICFFFF